MAHKSTFSHQQPEASLGFLLWQTTTLWQRLIKKVLEAYDISHAQFVVMAVTLWYMEHQEQPTQISIARLSKLDKMTVSKSLKKLVEQGYITRSESRSDTRAKVVNFTPKGKALIIQLVPMVEQLDAEFFGSIHQQDRAMLLAILPKLVAQEAQK